MRPRRHVDEDNHGDLLEVFEAARQAAVVSLWHTPDLLAVLAAGRVVDAGGAGLVLLYDAFLHVIDGRPIPDHLPLPPEVAAKVAADAGDLSSRRHDISVDGARATKDSSNHDRSAARTADGRARSRATRVPATR